MGFSSREGGGEGGSLFFGGGFSPGSLQMVMDGRAEISRIEDAELMMDVGATVELVEERQVRELPTREEI